MQKSQQTNNSISKWPSSGIDGGESMSNLSNQPGRGGTEITANARK